MKEIVSFTQEVKEEISSTSFPAEHLRAILAAFIRITGSLNFSNKETSLVLRTDNAKTAKFIYSAIEEVYGIVPHFSYSKMMNFKKKTSYNIIINNEVDYLLGDLEIDFLEGKISKRIVNHDDMIAGYLTGGFLASGSVNSPETSNYHLEIALNDPSYAKWFARLFQKYHSGQFDAKIVQRRNQSVVYLKRSDQISDFLILMGATEATLKFEEVRLEREFSNIGNRFKNLDTANYVKTSNAALNQIEDIKLIDKIMGIDKIDNVKERELMKLRLENDDASLQELANLLTERLNYDKPISRSNIAHLFKKIHATAEFYKEGKK